VGTVTEQPSTGARARKAHPLLGVFPLTVMSLATFLVLFTVLMARLTAVGGSALSSNRSVARAANGIGISGVRTRASGGGGSGATAALSGGAAPAIVTSASGAGGAKRSGDD
jgi:hypothetical protein